MELKPCAPSDLAAWLRGHDPARPKLTLPAPVYSRLVTQVLGGHAWAAWVTACPHAPVALVGIFDWPRGPGEIWLGAERDVTGRYMTPLIIQFRRVLRSWPTADRLMARVLPDNTQGQRVVCALGFAPTGVIVEGGQVWRSAWSRS